MKILLRITPQDVIGYVPKLGVVESVTSSSLSIGILHKLTPGDVALADRGFDISDSVLMQFLHLPKARGSYQH